MSQRGAGPAAHGSSLASDVRHMIKSTFFGRCPRCAQASIFRRGFELRHVCPACGLSMDSDGSPTLAAMIFSYSAALVGSLALGIWLMSGERLVGREMWVVIPVAVALVLGTQRPAKAWWNWLMWRTGHLGDAD